MKDRKVYKDGMIMSYEEWRMNYGRDSQYDAAA